MLGYTRAVLLVTHPQGRWTAFPQSLIMSGPREGPQSKDKGCREEDWKVPVWGRAGVSFIKAELLPLYEGTSEG